MIKKPITLDRVSYTRITQRNRQIAEDFFVKAFKYKHDLDKRERKAAHLCKPCYYIMGTVAGQAFTETECALCFKKLGFSSTLVDAICEECAKKKGLCRRCGGDLNSKVRRKIEL